MNAILKNQDASAGVMKPRTWGIVLAALSMQAALGCLPTTPLQGLEDPDPLDQQRLAEHPALRHLHDAWGSKGDPEVGQLFTELDLHAAPDPSELLASMARGNPPRAAQATGLRLRTFNVGLLDVSVFDSGFMGMEGPDLQGRRPTLFARAFSGEPDVVFLQEVWADEDIAEALSAGDAAGFLCEAFFVEQGKTGLVSCVREARLEVDSWHAEAMELVGVSGDVVSRGGGVLRSITWIDASLTGVGPVRLYNLHLSPMWEGRYQRMYQMRDVGLHARAVEDDRLVLLGGDLNAGPFYAQDRWRNAGGEQDGWWGAAVAYPLGLFYGDFVDLAVRGMSEPSADAEVRSALRVKNDPDRSLNEAHGDAELCGELRSALVTATDCNGLHFEQYAGEEPPSRLDHLWARDPAARVHVAQSHLVFVEPEVELPDGVVELSDHYGVDVALQVAAPTP